MTKTVQINFLNMQRKKTKIFDVVALDSKFQRLKVMNCCQVDLRELNKQQNDVNFKADSILFPCLDVVFSFYGSPTKIITED